MSALKQAVHRSSKRSLCLTGEYAQVHWTSWRSESIPPARHHLGLKRIRDAVQRQQNELERNILENVGENQNIQVTQLLTVLHPDRHQELVKIPH